MKYTVSVGPFSLVDSRGSPVEDSGLLLYNGGTVCGGSFFKDEAVAVCRALGYDVNGAEYDKLYEELEIQSTLQVGIYDIDCTDSQMWDECEYETGSDGQECDCVFLTCDGE